MKLAWSSSYKRSFKRLAKTNTELKKKILATMEVLQNNPFSPQLKAHKLRGILEGTWACTVDYKTRLLFDFVKNPTTGETEILLIDIGSHEEVY